MKKMYEITQRIETVQKFNRARFAIESYNFNKDMAKDGEKYRLEVVKDSEDASKDIYIVRMVRYRVFEMLTTLENIKAFSERHAKEYIGGEEYADADNAKVRTLEVLSVKEVAHS